MLRNIASLNIDGKNRLRLVDVAPSVVSASIIVRRSQQIKTAEIPGAIVRNAKTGIISTAPWTGRAVQVVLPPDLGKAESVDAAAIWKSVNIGYKESPNEKQPHSLQADTFAGLLLATDPAKEVVAMAKGLLNDEQFPRRLDLIRGAAEFAKDSEDYRAWRADVSGQMTNALTDYQKKLGEPSQLVATLERGLKASAVLNQISQPSANELKAQEQLRETYDLLQKEKAIAAALGKARYWDEFAAKLSEIGLAKWSFPDLVKLEPQALRQASQEHLKEAQTFEVHNTLDRSLDDALLAFHLLPCDAETTKYLRQVQGDFLEKNKGLESKALTPAKRKELDRLVNELDGSEDERPEYVLQKIREGPTDAKFYAPLQMLRAKSLMKLARLTEAQEVVRDVVRNIPLEPGPKKEWAQLDGRIHARLEDDLSKARTQVEELMRQEKYDQVLDLCARALTMDPEDFYFLDKQVRAAALLKKMDFARERTIWRMEHGNAACADGPALEGLLTLSMTSVEDPGVQHAAGGIKHWITGEDYPEGSVYYDPLSLGFLPRVKRIYEQKVEETFFEWREFQLAWVETKPVGQAEHATFSAEPQYAPGSVRMTAIGPRGGGSSYQLIYLNSPNVNVALLSKEKHKSVAMGWAPNPFFHPFYWKKLFLFELTYDDKGRVIKAKPFVSDANQRLDSHSQILNFEWENGSNRLRRIKGELGYERTLVYDSKNRLVEEKITDPKGNGSIRYQYTGNRLTPREAVCHSNFYDKGKKIIEFRTDE